MAKNANKVAKFQEILGATGQNVLDKRAEITFNKTKSAMGKLIADLEEQKEELELKKINLTDLSVETTDSLRATSADFKPKEWARQMVETEMSIQLLDDEIAVAQGIFAEYFNSEE